MKKYKSKLIGAVLIVLALILLIAIIGINKYFSGIDDLALCSESIMQERESPDQRYLATVYVRNCGATTDYVTHVNLQQSKKIAKPDSYGVIRSGQIWETTGKPKVQLIWKNDEKLDIEVRENSFKNIGVSDIKYKSIKVRIRIIQ